MGPTPSTTRRARRTPEDSHTSTASFLPPSTATCRSSRPWRGDDVVVLLSTAMVATMLAVPSVSSKLNRCECADGASSTRRSCEENESAHEVPLSGDAVAYLRPVGEVMSASCSVGNAALFSEARAVTRDRAVAAVAAVTRDRIRSMCVNM